MVYLKEKLVHGGDIYSPREIREGFRLADFSANINPLGMPEKVKRALTGHVEAYGQYPDPLCRELRGKIAQRYGIGEDWVLCGNGAADLLYRMGYGLKPEKALVMAPTFAEYVLAMEQCGCGVEHFDLDGEKDFQVDDGFLSRITDGVDMVFLCNPNNPTGYVLPDGFVKEAVKRCRTVGAVLVVDECFLDFLEEEEELTAVGLLGAYGNLIVLKAFTKMYAMAGIRLGYALCSSVNTLNRMEAAGQPWSVSAVAQVCGEAALGCGEHAVKTRVYIREQRERLKRELEAFGFWVAEGKANYLFFRTDILDLDERLEEYGVLIRSCGNYHNLDRGYFRVGVKGEEDNGYLLDCLKLVIQGVQG